MSMDGMSKRIGSVAQIASGVAEEATVWTLAWYPVWLAVKAAGGRATNGAAGSGTWEDA